MLDLTLGEGNQAEKHVNTFLDVPDNKDFFFFQNPDVPVV